MGEEIETPWDFACNWYTVEQTREYLQQRQPDGDVPDDVHSDEFAEWLTNQMRLALSRGIVIGEQRQADIDDTKAEQQGAEAGCHESGMA